MITPHQTPALIRRRWAFGSWVRALGVASVAHVMLGDYDQAGWATPRVIGGLCALLLMFTPARAAGLRLGAPRPPSDVIWAVTSLTFAATKLYTLLALRDVLTQSVLLTSMHLLAALGLLYPRLDERCMCAAVWCASLTYSLAVLHKLNYDFLYTPQSCAIHGVELALSVIPSSFSGALGDSLNNSLNHSIVMIKSSIMGYAVTHPLLIALSVISLEVTLGALCLARHRAVWFVGALFHVPLTLTIAPAFGSVCAAGWGAGWMLKHARPSRRRHRAGRARLKRYPLITSRVSLIPLFYGLHGALSPYVGLEVQHCAAMLSNLRVDSDCANSVVMPVLSSPPYISIEEISWGERGLAERAERVRETLWSLAALHTMRRNWCIPENRPLKLSGSTRLSDSTSRSFVIADLCAEGSLDMLDQGAWFPAGWQRFQKNLTRRCHTPCVH